MLMSRTVAPSYELADACELRLFAVQGPCADGTVPIHALTGLPSCCEIMILVWPFTHQRRDSPGMRTRMTGSYLPLRTIGSSCRSLLASSRAAAQLVSPSRMSIRLAGTF